MKTLTIHSKKHGEHQLLYDDEDEGLVSQYTWHVNKCRKDGIYYCHTNIRIDDKWKIFKFHRLVLGVTNPRISVDHINRNGLDNRKDNLRKSTTSQNSANSRREKGLTSPYKGVNLRTNGRFIARITVESKTMYLGDFSTEEEAAKAYNKAALQHFGDYAYLNKIK